MENLSKEQYNNEPVHYCAYCLSLKIKTVAGGSLGLDCCDECGGTDIQTTHIEVWQKMYKERYGVDFLNRTLT